MHRLPVARFVLLWLALCAVLAACGARQPAVVLPVPVAASASATASATPSPTASRTATATATATPGIASYVAYRVKPGDTLAAIAATSGADPEYLLRYNRLATTPQAGRELIIPQLEGHAHLPEPGMMVLHGNTTQPWVALTLDCGNTYGHMGPILDILREADVRLTMFLTGSLVEDSPGLVRQMAADGHELADHSYSHPDFRKLSNQQIGWELQRNEAMIQAMLGPAATLRPYFRFPYGAYNRRALKVVLREGYLPVHWSLDVLDSVGEPKTPEFVVERIMNLPDEELRGAIILGHCTSAVRGALPTLIARLRAAGYELRTLSNVLGE